MTRRLDGDATVISNHDSHGAQNGPNLNCAREVGELCVISSARGTGATHSWPRGCGRMHLFSESRWNAEDVRSSFARVTAS
jgi:hypothetical protein